MNDLNSAKARSPLGCGPLFYFYIIKGENLP